MDIFKILRTPRAATTSPSFGYIYLISVVFTFHTLLTAYTSSTYMEQFTTPQGVGVLYAFGSALAIMLFLTLPRILTRLGNTNTTILFSLLAVISLTLLGFGLFPLVAFVAFQALNPLIFLNIDIFSEQKIGDNESETGSKRGLTLALMSVAAVLAPLTVGYIVSDDSTTLSRTYFLAAAIGLLFTFLIAFIYRHFNDAPYPTIRLGVAWKSLINNRNIHSVVAAQLLLQFFFAWAVIYFPLYLATEIGLPWSDIGKIIAVGLFAYVIFEYPIGILADRFIGEKEMMAIGFVFLALASAGISFLAGASIGGWMAIMFLSRVGGSLVEVTTESYFFKQVKSTDAHLISIFRLTRPLAYLVGATAGSIALYFLPFDLIFIVLGCIMVPGIALAASLTDTR